MLEERSCRDIFGEGFFLGRQARREGDAFLKIYRGGFLEQREERA